MELETDLEGTERELDADGEHGLEAELAAVEAGEEDLRWSPR